MVRKTQNQRPVADRQLSGAEKTRKRKREEEAKRKDSGSLMQYLRVPPQPPRHESEATAIGNSNSQGEVGTSQTKPGEADAIPSNFRAGVQTEQLDDENSSEGETDVSSDEGKMDTTGSSDDSETGEKVNDNLRSKNKSQSPSDQNSKLQNSENCLDSPVQCEPRLECDADIDIDYSDPSTWPVILSQQIRNLIIQKGPVQKVLQDYPTVDGRSFHNSHYRYQAVSGESQGRDWLLYSEKTNSLFCFACILFSKPTQNTSWTNFGGSKSGFADFLHQARAIKEHGLTHQHFAAVIDWKSYLKNSRSNQSLSAKARAEYHREVTFWQSVLRSMIDAVLYLAKNSLAFRGSTDNIKEPNCGNYLSLLELLSHYHAPLAQHIKGLQKGKLSYMSPGIQNEFISLVAGNVRRSIVEEIRHRKYYSILFDATPDCSHKEQISQVIRSVLVSESGCSIQEHFVDFIHYDQKKGEQISQQILEKLKNDGLDIANCRGQGYDNGANMSGAYNGVQAHIKKKNDLAEYVPCVAHSLNLVGQNAASKFLHAKLLLGQIQALYVFFASSPQRWNVLKPRVSRMLKSQSLTRWSSKAHAVATLYQEFEGVLESLTEIIDDDQTNPETLAASTAHYNQINNFRFLFGLTIWKAALNQIDLANVALQNKKIDIGNASKQMDELSQWLTNFRENGFMECLEKARSKAETLDINEDSGFQYRITRGRRPKRFRDEDNESVENVTKSNIEKFELEFFNPLADQLITEFENRFRILRQTNQKFNFLWGEKLASSSAMELKNCCIELASKYKNDLDCATLMTEIEELRSAVTFHLSKSILEETTAMDVLNILTCNLLKEQFINCHTALRIFLTMPVTVAENERSFSKLKIIKNYLRSTMGQERLSNLAILSIEQEQTSSLNFDSLIDEFASAKCRKVAI